MNMDVCGIGVRISFYLQTLFLACWSLRSYDPQEIAGALYTVIITNMAMTVTVLIHGLKPEPEISFHDALIAFYLIFLSTFIVTLCCLYKLASRILSPSMLGLLSIVQTYAFFALGFILLARADTFGNTPACNNNGLIVMFQSYSIVPSGRVVGYTLVTLLFVMYTGYIIWLHNPALLKKMAFLARKQAVLPLERDVEWTQRNQNADSHNNTERHASRPFLNIKINLQSILNSSVNVDFILISGLLLFLVIPGVVIGELLIKRSNFAPDPDPRSDWQFGQVLPMFLVIIPLVGLLGSFREHGLRRMPVAE